MSPLHWNRRLAMKVFEQGVVMLGVVVLGVFALAEGCPQLAIVDFRACDQLTNASVIALTTCCMALHRVNNDSKREWETWP